MKALIDCVIKVKSNLINSLIKACHFFILA